MLLVWVTLEALGILENWVLPLDIMGSTDRMTAPEVTGRPAGVKTGGAGALFMVGLGGRIMGRLEVGNMGGTKGGLVLTSCTCLTGGACCCWNWGDSKGGPGLTNGCVLVMVTSVLHLVLGAAVDTDGIMGGKAGAETKVMGVAPALLTPAGCGMGKGWP